MWCIQVLGIIFVRVIFIQAINTDDSYILSQETKDKINEEISYIKGTMNEDINPCDNFYKYTCGKFKVDPSRWKPIYNSYEDVFNSGNYLSEAEKKAKVFYDSCKDPGFNLEHLKEMDVSKEIGGWPVFEPDWKPEQFNWLKAAAVFKRNFSFNVFVDLKIRFWRAPGEYLLLEELSLYILGFHWDKDFYNLMINNGIDNRTAASAIEEIESFTEHLGHSAGLPYLEVNYTELKNLIPIDWDEYFTIVLGEPLNDTSTLQVSSVPTIKSFFEEVQRTDPRVLANFLWLAFFHLHRQNCDLMLSKYFEPVTPYLRNRPFYIEDDLVTIIDQVEKSYDEIIKPTPWVDDLTEKNSRAYINLIKQWLHYSNPRIESCYQDIEIVPDNFLKNVENLGPIKAELDFKSVNQCALKETETVEPEEDEKDEKLNSNYDLELNNYYRLFETGEYQIDMPMSVNFARYGAKIAKRMIQGIDTDKHWKSDKATDNFEMFENCIESEFGNFSDLRLLSRYTKSEWMIILQAAIRQSYTAYKNWLDDPKNQMVDSVENEYLQNNFNLTSDKLFFLSHVSNNCGSDNAFWEITWNENMRSIPDFSEIFQCPEGSEMSRNLTCKFF